MARYGDFGDEMGHLVLGLLLPLIPLAIKAMVTIAGCVLTALGRLLACGAQAVARWVRGGGPQNAWRAITGFASHLRIQGR